MKEKTLTNTSVWWVSPDQKMTNISEEKAARLASSQPKRVYFFAELVPA